MPKLLIIDDEDKLRALLARILGLEGFTVLQAPTAAAGLRLIEKEAPDIILCDVKLPDMSGLELLGKIKALAPETQVILLTAYGTISDGVEAIKKGAFDYLTKGDDNERIIPLVMNALEKRNLRRRVENLEQRIKLSFDFTSITGTSKPIRQAVSLATRVAPTSTTVLLQGETGTGKEVFAQAIHEASGRKKNSFLAINCSGFSREIMESELFGYRAGAFTGALKNKRGLFEEADGGTLFLDEIGEIPLDIQAKLLRVLENGSFLKLGETQERKVDVRIIAATNKTLKEEVENGRFREDLYFRISAFTIFLPPLRERREDILLLADHFIDLLARKQAVSIRSVSPEFKELLRNHRWKGNIRELKNVLERAVILSEGGILSAELLPDDIRYPKKQSAGPGLDLQSMEASHIAKVLHDVDGNKAEAARVLNIGISTLYRKIEDYHI